MREFQEFERNELIEELIDYIESELPKFVSSQTFSKIMVVKKNETQHSTAFVLFMLKNQNKFSFIPEVAQVGTHKIDVAVYDKLSDEMLFTIEAKILPTLPGTKKKPRAESEYVYSNLGESGAGIQRFRLGYHGVNDEQIQLPENGMLAYIKCEDFNFWLAKVNQWILDAKWDQSEQLEKIHFNSIGKLKSKHPTANGSKMILHHFWVKV